MATIEKKEVEKETKHSLFVRLESIISNFKVVPNLCG